MFRLFLGLTVLVLCLGLILGIAYFGSAKSIAVLDYKTQTEVAQIQASAAKTHERQETVRTLVVSTSNILQTILIVFGVLAALWMGSRAYQRAYIAMKPPTYMVTHNHNKLVVEMPRDARQAKQIRMLAD